MITSHAAKKKDEHEFFCQSKHFFPLKIPPTLYYRSSTYLQMQCWIRGLHEAGGTYKLVISPA